MGFHTYPVDRADALEDAAARYRYLSVEELLWLLDVGPGATVADLGSGTGFYTDHVAPAVGRVYAVDVQPEMHDLYREKGVPANVDLVTAGAEDLPFADGALDGLFSTMTYHEFATPAALDEIVRVLAPGAALAVADWTAAGPGADGPPPDERFALADVLEALGGFDVEFAAERRETFLLRARR